MSMNAGTGTPERAPRPERAASGSSGASGGKFRKPFVRPFRDSSLKTHQAQRSVPETDELPAAEQAGDPERTPTPANAEFPGALDAVRAAGQDDSVLAGLSLPRDGSSFTVHGKKASVVTFGGEWAESAEERLAALQAMGGAGRHRAVPGSSPLSSQMRARSVSGGSATLRGMVGGGKKAVGGGMTTSDGASVKTGGSAGTVVAAAIGGLEGGVNGVGRGEDGEGGGTPTPTPSLRVVGSPMGTSPESGRTQAAQ
jgi:hypothetical protein